MRITRLAKDVMIRMSDSEFEALTLLVELGQQDAIDETQLVSISDKAKREITIGRFSGIDAMHIDEDRRS